MPNESNFKGFSKETVGFFNNLKKNNTREWFNNHRQDYENFVMRPAKAFVTAMGVRLRTISPSIIAVPKVNKSLFRINKDTRFSLDKSPYKTNLGIYFWEGIRPRMESSGFYFHVEPPILLLGVGIYVFPKHMLDRYRNAVVDPESGAELSVIIKRISKLEGYALGRKHYKRVPSGYDSSHPNAELLLHNGLHASYETAIPEEFYSEKLVDYCLNKFKPLVPLHKWLASMNIRRFHL